MAPLVPDPSLRDRAWLLERERCVCRDRALKLRRYLGRWLCLRCNGWLPKPRVRWRRP